MARKSVATEECFQECVSRLFQAVGHTDRRDPLRAYIASLRVPGARKSVEPMAAKIAPRPVESRHQAWVVDDTGIPKKGRHSVGVARHYCGVLGKQDNRQVAIDGKTLRRSFREAGSKSFVHLVSAFATSNRVALAQVKTDEKSNEITAIPRLRQRLTIKGCLATIDAMGCQKDIAASIIDAGADDLLGVKDNQPTMMAESAAIFEHARRDPKGLDLDFHETRKQGHGGTEARRCWPTGLVEGLSQQREWRNLNSLVMVEVDRTVGEHTSTKQRDLISSQLKLTASPALSSSRRHWGIEIEVHGTIDVAFREDDCRIRAGSAAQSFSVMRHLSLNLLKAVKSAKGGLRARRLLAGWDNDFRLKVLTATP